LRDKGERQMTELQSRAIDAAHCLEWTLQFVHNYLTADEKEKLFQANIEKRLEAADTSLDRLWIELESGKRWEEIE
jgi:hypothetical protein